MAVRRTLFGPGTLTLDPNSALTSGKPGPLEISCQVSSGGVQHEYEDTQDAVKTLGGCEVPGKTERRDSLAFDVLADLTDGGIYDFLMANDLSDCEFMYEPQAAGASWGGQVQLRLPDAVQADEYGQPLSGSVTWPGVGAFVFVPDSATP